MQTVHQMMSLIINGKGRQKNRKSIANCRQDRSREQKEHTQLQGQSVQHKRLKSRSQGSTLQVSHRTDEMVAAERGDRDARIAAVKQQLEEIRARNDKHAAEMQAQLHEANRRADHAEAIAVEQIQQAQHEAQRFIASTEVRTQPFFKEQEAGNQRGHRSL